METKSKSKYIKLEDILKNEPRELVIPGVGKIKIRDPTRGERMDAEKEASTHPNWNNMNITERTMEIQTRIAMKMLVEPKISNEDYINANDPVILNILDCIWMDYIKRMKLLTDKRSKEITDFLELIGVKNPVSSIIS